MSTDLRESVEGWLRALGCQYRPVPDPQMVWHLEVQYPPGRPDHFLHVAELKGTVPSLVIASLTRVSDQHVEVFNGLPVDEQRAFLFGLRHTLNSPEVDFELQGMSSGPSCPRAFQVTARRFVDGLTLDAFARSIGSVYKGELSGIWFIQENLEHDSFGPAVVFDFERSSMPQA